MSAALKIVASAESLRIAVSGVEAEPVIEALRQAGHEIVPEQEADLVLTVTRGGAAEFGALDERPTFPLLTPREVDVLTAMADGLSNKEMARRLGISPHTVKFHAESLFRKLGVNTRAEAVAYGMKRRLLETMTV
jgi:DNA-binding NarL/FixJ family response regulator